MHGRCPSELENNTSVTSVMENVQVNFFSALFRFRGRNPDGMDGQMGRPGCRLLGRPHNKAKI